MSDALSYVYRGREGTGVAQVLKQPTPVAPPKPDTKFLDSLGEDIRKGGTVWEVDRPEIMAKRNRLIDFMAKIYASGKDPRTDPQLAKEVLDLRQDYVDSYSKSNLDQKSYFGEDKNLRTKTGRYKPQSRENLDAWRDAGLNRPITPVGVERYSETDYTDILDDSKNYWESKIDVRIDKNGKETTVQVPTFNEPLARQQYQVYANANKDNYKYQGYWAAKSDRLEEQMGDNFTKLSPSQQAVIIDKAIEDDYVNRKMANKPIEKDRNKEAPIDKTKDGEGDGTNPINIEGDYFTSWKYDANGNLIKQVSWKINPTNEKNKDLENKLDWTDTDGTVYTGKLVRPMVDELGNVTVIVNAPKMQPNSVTGALEKVGNFEKELPLTGVNKGYLKTFYKFDVDKVLSKDAPWRSAIDNMPLPSVKDFPANKSPNQQKKVQEAIDKRKGSTPAPKAKTAAEIRAEKYKKAGIKTAQTRSTK